MIRTKSIYDGKSKEDGYRVLVTRYWPRGIKKAEADEWIKDLGPSAGLIRLWKDKEISWDEFRKRYLEEHAAEEAKKEALERLKGIVNKEKKVTLLCTCRDEVCHRTILKEMLRR